MLVATYFLSLFVFMITELSAVRVARNFLRNLQNELKKIQGPKT